MENKIMGLNCEFKQIEGVGIIGSKGEQTKQHIIEQAALLLNKQGYMSTSLSEIMTVTNMKKGSLLNYFKNKEELVSLAFGHCLSLLENYVRLALSKSDTSKGRLLSFIDAFCSLEADAFPGGCPIINVTVEVYDGLSERLQEQARAGMDYLSRMVAEIVEEGIRTGEFKRDLDARQVVSYVISACEGGLLMNKLYRVPFHSQYVRQFLLAFVDKEVLA